MNVSEFIQDHYHHFNAGALKAAAKDLVRSGARGDSLMITMAGAMSTARIGTTLAEMIRQDRVQAVTCTGANLEEDLFRLVGQEHYTAVPQYRTLDAEDENTLCLKGLPRVTDVCIPEEHTVDVVAAKMKELWMNSDKAKLPHEYFYEYLTDLDIDRYVTKDSWLYAAYERGLPLFVPGWEDSTMGNIFAAEVFKKEVNPYIVEPGTAYMRSLIEWYGNGKANAFFQIGGGIAGDFPICVVPLLEQYMKMPALKWSYFCQVSDSTTSYGSYSGAVPNEKISWGKLDVDTPSHIIESDATIVVPLIFAFVLGW